MLNLYEVLGCVFDAPHEQLKCSYRKLVLKYHPDKQKQMEESSSYITSDAFPRIVDGEPTDTHFLNRSADSQNAFHLIENAWSVLRDSETRAEYNATWTQYCLAQQWPIQETIHFSEFDATQGDDVSEVNEMDRNYFTYVTDCRCGGIYSIQGWQKSLKMDIVCCDSCSLSIRVLYEEDDVT